MLNFRRYLMMYADILAAACAAYPQVSTFPFGKYSANTHLSRLRELRSHFRRKPSDLPIEWARDPKMVDFLNDFSLSYTDTHMLIGPRAALSMPRYVEDTYALPTTDSKRVHEISAALSERELYALMLCHHSGFMPMPSQLNNFDDNTLSVLEKYSATFPNCGYFQHPNCILIS